MCGTAREPCNRQPTAENRRQKTGNITVGLQRQWLDATQHGTLPECVHERHVGLTASGAASRPRTCCRSQSASALACSRSAVSIPSLRACVCLHARAKHTRARTRACACQECGATLLCRRRAACNMQHATDNRQHATCARCMGVSLFCRRRESLCRYIWRSSRTRWRAAMPPALIRSDRAGLAVAFSVIYYGECTRSALRWTSSTSRPTRTASRAESGRQMPTDGAAQGCARDGVLHPLGLPGHS